jgi:hypothetical protein
MSGVIRLTAKVGAPPKGAVLSIQQWYRTVRHARVCQAKCDFNYVQSARYVSERKEKANTVNACYPVSFDAIPSLD